MLSDLGRQAGSGPPGWTFTKYLVGADGRLIARWSSKTPPEDPEIVRRSRRRSRLTAPELQGSGSGGGALR